MLINEDDVCRDTINVFLNFFTFCLRMSRFLANIAV